ncbi:hypothetical protein EGW08_004946 [Elysia chlorotica]|uniref:3'-5' exonuclease domain-containing protein n=1 Tax=Elysia chlorotica TaxID=188477 RepID=A0A433U0C5_ELYCH|nr:hypothetical protein EGW08_004946 [Elysia chlorotica]
MELESVARSKALLQSIKLPKSCRVKITIANDVNSTFTGVLHAIDQTLGKITLKNVSTAGCKLYGPQIYYCKDILDIQVVSDVQEAQDSSPDKSKRAKQMYQQRKRAPPHLTRLRNLDDDSLILSNILRDELVDQGIGSDEDNFEDFYVHENYTLICRVCEKFYDAIEYIMNQDAVGVEVNGQKMGRDGILSLVQIATDSELIIFDILRLGDEAFKAGLQAVFESDGLMKVIHDCRFLADLLRCQHNVSMANVFDTQVANAFVYRSVNEGDWPRFVESLPGCLICYLKLPPQHVQFTQVRERCKEKDEAVWLTRPLPEKLLEAATKNTVHLLKLQEVLLVEMLAEFKAAVGIYLNYVSGTVTDVEKCRVNSHLLPIAFTYLHKFVKDQSGSSWQDPKCFSRKGFRENNVAVPSDAVIFSHDSPWHKNRYALGKNLTQNTGTQESKHAEVPAVPAEERRYSPKKCSQRHKEQILDTATRTSVAACGDNNSTDSVKDVKSLDCGKTAHTSPKRSEQILESPTLVHPKTQGVGELLKKSGLWKMSVENKEQSLLQLHNAYGQRGGTFSGQPNEKGPQPAIPQAQDLSDQEMDQAKELKRQMALLDQLHFVPANPTAVAKSCILQPKDFSKQESDSSSSLSRPSNKYNSPNLTKASRPSLESSGSDSPRSKPSNMPSLMPAGMQRSRTNKSKKRLQSPCFNTVSGPTEAGDSLPGDFSMIPTPQSLIHRKEQVLGVSSIGMGNPFSEDEGFSTPSNWMQRASLKSFAESPDGEAISDAELDLLLKSDKSQRILKLAALKPSTNVRDKILPLPCKMKSPQAGSS